MEYVKFFLEHGLVEMKSAAILKSERLMELKKPPHFQKMLSNFIKEIASTCMYRFHHSSR